ncbi:MULTISPECIES: toprim domain-containing protein [Mycobacterium]|uniref:toprim domain-containing protein n=1 Tax=Mycobacterium TaxID=1763 RepID=UPI0005EDAE77|nr:MULTISPECIES: toprim domain-containing protein [Mycobacterium]MCV7034824.1 toprim domain-containing protein [Mycobacterium heckeshornense]
MNLTASHQSRGVGKAFDTVRAAFEASGQEIRPRGTHAFMASCPMHTDATPSLSVTWREAARTSAGGVVLLHCFSCQAAAGDIAAAIGLHVTDLFDNPAPATGARTRSAARPAAPKPAPLPARITAPRSEPTAAHRWQRARVYTYTTAQGRPVQQVIRDECDCTGRPHKRFRQRYRDGRQWVYRKPENFTPVLYRARAIAATTAGAWVWLTEGEKDADTAASLGRVATTNAQGSASFPTELVAEFDGLKVAVVADRDPAGYQRAITLHQQLHPVAAQVVLLLPAVDANKADLTDHVQAGLWQDDDPFGGLLEVTVSDLEALTLVAKAHRVGDRVAVALEEAAAHRARALSHTDSQAAAARWVTEASSQLTAIRGYQRDLQRHAAQHDSPLIADALQAMTALRAQAERRYRAAASHNSLACTEVRPAKPATRVGGELDDDWWLRVETTTGAA